MTWVAETAAIEEIGCLGMALGCAFVMPSIVGEALNMFGTEQQKQKYLEAVSGRKTRLRGGFDRTTRRV